MPFEICQYRSRRDSVVTGAASLIVTQGNHQARQLANAANAHRSGWRRALEAECLGLGVRRLPGLPLWTIRLGHERSGWLCCHGRAMGRGLDVALEVVMEHGGYRQGEQVATQCEPEGPASKRTRSARRTHRR